MAILKAMAKQTSALERVSEGADVSIKALRDGSLTTAEFLENLSIEGRIFCVNVGTVTSPITFAAGNITTTTPDLIVDVPLGTTVIPLEIRIKMEAFGSDGVFECMAAVGKGGAQANGTAVTPQPLNTGSTHASACTIERVSTGVTYMTSKVSEFWRDGHIKAITTATGDNAYAAGRAETFSWIAKDRGIYPIVEGAGCLAVYCTAQAGTGFITFVYAEVPSTYLS